MHNMTKVELVLIQDPEMYLFFEKGILIFLKRYSKASNTYLKSYDPEKNENIIYLDKNNFYGYAMSKFLATSGFKWIDRKQFDLNKYIINSSEGCVIKAVLAYPNELCELLNVYPLAPDKIEIKKEMSTYQLIIADPYNIPIGNDKKFVPNFF